MPGRPLGRPAVMPTRWPGLAPAELDDAPGGVGDQRLGRLVAAASRRPARPTSARSGGPSLGRGRARRSARSGGARRPAGRSARTASGPRARRGAARARRRRGCARSCRRGRIGAAHARGVPVLVRRDRLGLFGDRRHHRDRLDRVGADRGLLGEHHRVGAVEDRVGHVGDLGARRARGGDHRVEHLRGGDRRPRQPARRARSSCFCTIGTRSIGSSMPRSPRATITQSAALRISSARSTACGFSILAISGSRVCSRTCSTSSGRRTNDSATMSTPIDSPWRSSSRSSSGTAGSDVDRAGDVQALARGDRAADLDLGFDLARAAARTVVDAQPHRAVGEVEHVARLERVGEARPRRCSCARASPALVARRRR